MKRIKSARINLFGSSHRPRGSPCKMSVPNNKDSHCPHESQLKLPPPARKCSSSTGIRELESALGARIHFFALRLKHSYRLGCDSEPRSTPSSSRTCFCTTSLSDVLTELILYQNEWDVHPHCGVSVSCPVSRNDSQSRYIV